MTAIPTPVDDIGSDLFFLHQVVFADESAVTDRTRGGTMVQIDSKAMRKVVDGTQPLGIAQVSAITQGVIFATAGRMLVKLN